MTNKELTKAVQELTEEIATLRKIVVGSLPAVSIPSVWVEDSEKYSSDSWTVTTGEWTTTND